MKALLTTDLAFVAILTMGITGLSPDRCLAADPVCVTNSGSTERVCVEWGKQAPPEEDDFDVDYSCQGCSDAPDVELKTGDTGWVMYSEVISSGVAANIGALTTTDSDNYGVKIAKGTAAGAANVGSMVLSPDGASYSSSILSGSKISGDLTGNLTLQKSSGGEGGAVDLTIDGDTEGDIQAADIVYLSIGGSLSGDIGSQEERVGDISGSLSVDDAGTASIYLENLSGSLIIDGDLKALDINDDVGDEEASATLQVWDTLSDSLDIGGDVYGNIYVMRNTADVTGGTVKEGSQVTLAQSGSSYPYIGTATFTAVESAGLVMTCGTPLGSAEEVGKIHITGDVAGRVRAWIPGSAGLAAKGQIEIGGNLSGSVEVGTGALGVIEIGGEVTATGHVEVTGDFAGELTIVGDIVDGASIDIDGEMTGEICADNLDPDEDLPDEVNIVSFGPAWTICGEYGCTCDGASCTNDYDCNDNDTYDLCEVLDRTVDDCDCDLIPDAGGTCDPANQDAELVGSVPGDEGSLWRTQKNITRLTFCCDVTAPDSGDVPIQEMLDDGEFDDDLSSGFGFSVENDSVGDPRILKITETGSSLDHGRGMPSATPATGTMSRTSKCST